MITSDVLKLPLGESLDLVVDEVVYGVNHKQGDPAPKCYGWSDETAWEVYSPFAKKMKWTMTYNLYGLHKGWIVSDGEEVICSHPDRRLAMLRAVLHHHLVKPTTAFIPQEEEQGEQKPEVVDQKKPWDKNKKNQGTIKQV